MKAKKQKVTHRVPREIGKQNQMGTTKNPTPTCHNDHTYTRGIENAKSPSLIRGVVDLPSERPSQGGGAPSRNKKKKTDQKKGSDGFRAGGSEEIEKNNNQLGGVRGKRCSRKDRRGWGETRSKAPVKKRGKQKKLFGTKKNRKSMAELPSGRSKNSKLTAKG